MSNREADILQIRKYLQGELDAKAMHRLERRAQDDPFLMDAMEGYGIADGDQQDSLSDLSERLAQRITAPRRKIVPLWMISAAASVLIICSVGIWWFYKSSNTNVTPARQMVASTVKPNAPSPPTAPPVNAKAPVKQLAVKKNTVETVKYTAPLLVADNPVVNKPPVAKELAIREPRAAVKQDVATYKNTASLSEVVISSPLQNAVDTSLFVRKSPLLKNTNTNAPLQLLQGNVKGVTQQIPPRGDLNKAITQGYISGPMANQLLANNDLTNRILDRNSSLAVANSSLKNTETAKATPENAGELFKKKADSISKKMGLLSSQYKTMPVGTTVADTVKNAAPAAGTDLSEEVVIGYTSQKKDVNDADAVPAHPQKGWSSFKNYLKTNAVSPDGKEGVVKLSFMVDRFGSITAIKVIDGLSEAADKKAISMVKDGPEWTGNSNKKPEKVHLRIRFSKRS